MALGTAVIVGVGPGLGLALARTFADAGHPVAMLALDKAKLDTYAAEVASTGRGVRCYVADAADPPTCGLRSTPRSPSWALPTCSSITSGCFARTRPSAVTTSTGRT